MLFLRACALGGRISIGSRVAPKSVAGLAPARAANLLPPSNQVRRAGARFPPWFCAAFAPLPTSACLQSWPTPAKSMRPSRDPAARPVHGVRGPPFLHHPSQKSPPSGEEMVGNAHSAFTAEDRCPGKRTGILPNPVVRCALLQPLIDAAFVVVPIRKLPDAAGLLDGFPNRWEFCSFHAGQCRR